jgi:hypothetical protein
MSDMVVCKVNTRVYGVKNCNVTTCSGEIPALRCIVTRYSSLSIIETY